MSAESLSYPPARPAHTSTAANRVLSLPALVVTSLVILFVALRLRHITSYSLWGGEAFTLIGAQKSWSDMIAYVAADIVHPPLVYILLKLWITAGGESLLWLKLFPVLSGVAVIVPFLLLCRELKLGLPATSLALLMVAVNGYLIHYTQELRMYSLFMFLALCAFWLFIRFYHSPGFPTRQLLLLTAVNLLALYTHYYGWVVVGLKFLFLLLWQRQRVVAFSYTVLFLLICFAPWAYLVAGEVRSLGGLEQNLDWIPKPRLANLLNLYVTFNGPIGNRYTNLLGLALFGLPLLLWARQLWRAGLREPDSELVRFFWLALLAFGPVLALFGMSQGLEQAVWMDRYFIFIAIPYMMLVAAAVYRVRPVWLRNSWVVALVMWSLIAGFNDGRTNRMAWESPQLGSRVDWDGLIRQMIAAEAGTAGPINVYTLTVVSNGYRTGPWALSTSIDYFMAVHGDDRFRPVYARDGQAVLGQVQEDHFWIGFFELPEWPQRSPAMLLANSGFRVGEPLVFQAPEARLVLLPAWRE
jgi:uncharacterized membrane protein